MLRAGFVKQIRRAGWSKSAMIKTADAYYREHSFSDFRVVSTLGISEGDIEAAEAVSGVAAANAINKQTDAYERKFAVRQSPMGIGVRRGDFDLLQWLNTEVMMLWTSGELQDAQKEWLGLVNSEMPPRF